MGLKASIKVNADCLAGAAFDWGPEGSCRPLRKAG